MATTIPWRELPEPERVESRPPSGDARRAGEGGRGTGRIAPDGFIGRDGPRPDRSAGARRGKTDDN